MQSNLRRIASRSDANELRRCSKTMHATQTFPATKSSETRPTYAIVGAGSAGCVLANRLSEDPNATVLLLEAGPSDHWWEWKIHMPGALIKNLCTEKYNWAYETKPEANMNRRQMRWPRGRVWGGSSALNVMVYMRGHPLDFDRWGKEGAVGWSYASCLPYFKKSQTYVHGGDPYRGDKGPLKVSRPTCDSPIFHAWLKAGVEAGYGYTHDVNGFRQEGVAPFDQTVYKGKRWSTSQAYLRPALKRPNLKTLTGVQVSRILFEGKRAIGLEYVTNGETKKILVDNEVILCGGAVNSPTLLQLSGVGDADLLKSLEIPVVQHTAGVGSNLQDHLGLLMTFKCHSATHYDQYTWKYPLKLLRNGLQWFLARGGIFANAPVPVGGFVRSESEVPHPDIEYQLTLVSINPDASLVTDQHSFALHVQQLRPKSRGFIRIQSKNPSDHPFIQPNYLSTDYDKKVMRQTIKHARRIFAQKAFEPLKLTEIEPGLACQTDSQLDAFISEMAETVFHPTCTCKMGKADDKNAVLDGETLKVWGLEGLRVVDASSFPSIVSGNTNAAVIMLAERAADIIRNKLLLPDENVPVWSHKIPHS